MLIVCAFCGEASTNTLERVARGVEKGVGQACGGGGSLSADESLS